MRNRVVLIITDGCEACAFMQRIIAKAYYEAKVEDISIGVYDFQDREVEDLIQKNNVKDFPTTLFIQDGKTIGKFIGTRTKDEVVAKIKHFEDN